MTRPGRGELACSAPGNSSFRGLRVSDGYAPQGEVPGLRTRCCPDPEPDPGGTVAGRVWLRLRGGQPGVLLLRRLGGAAGDGQNYVGSAALRTAVGVHGRGISAIRRP